MTRGERFPANRRSVSGGYFGFAIPIAAILSVLSADEPSTSIKVEQCRVTFLEEIDVPALESGPLSELLIQDNQLIEEDQPLARLDDTQLQVQRRIADVKGTQLDQRLSSNLEVEVAAITYEDAKMTADADERLHQSSPGAVPLLKLRRSQLALRRAELEKDRVVEQRRDAQLQLQVHRAEAEYLDHRLQRLQVLSPLSGIVLETVKRRGEWVNQGETVAKVARLDRLRITAILRETQLSMRSAQGTPVAIHWQEAAQGFHLRGLITSVDPQMHNDEQYRVHVDIENRKLESGWLLMPGRSVVLTIYPRTDQQLELPPSTARRLGLPQGELR